MLPQPEELLRIAEALRAGAAHSPRVQRERESTHRNRRIALVSCCASGSKLLHARGDWNGPSRRRSRSRRALRSEGRARPEVPTAIFPRRVLRSPRPSQRPSESDAPAEAQATHKQQYSGQSEIHPIIPNPYRAAVCLAPTRGHGSETPSSPCAPAAAARCKSLLCVPISTPWQPVTHFRVWFSDR